MARFTDQFQRYNPRKFQPSLMLPTWPKLAQMDANALLDGATDEDVAELAHLVELEIDAFADPQCFPTKDTGHPIWTRVRPEWLSQNLLKSKEGIRFTFCDLNILLALVDERDILAGTQMGQRFSTWHLFAVLALWKLIDGRDAIFGEDVEIPGLLRPTEKDRINHGHGIAMEAQAAIYTALQLKERARHLNEMQRARNELDRITASNTAKKRVNSRHQKDDPSRLEAFRIQDTYPAGTPKTVVAEDVSNNVTLDGGQFVTYGTAYGWLLKRGEWEKKIRARAS